MDFWLLKKGLFQMNHNFQKPRYHQVEIQKITETKNYFKIILTQSLSYFKPKYAKIIKNSH